MIVTAPAASKCFVADSERLSGISPGVRASAISDTGTFTHSTHSQPSASVRMPPSSTPTAPAEPATAPQAPSALLRSAPSLNSVVTIDSAAGETIAAPSPWAARAAISCALGVGEAGGQRGDRDQRQPGHEHPPPPEEVRGPAAKQQEAPERDQVGVHDPGQVLLGEVQAPADAGQGDVHDRGVQDDDELGHAEQDQRGPSSCRGSRLSSSSGWPSHLRVAPWLRGVWRGPGNCGVRADPTCNPEIGFRFQLR